MFCVLFAGSTPVATTVTLAVYGAACGARPDPSMVSMRLAGAPGRTYPLVGETDSQLTPDAEAVNDTGAPVVERLTGTLEGSTAAVTEMAGGLIDNTGSGWVTVRITGTVTGTVEAVPVVATMIDAWCVPTAIPVGFTRTLRLAGIFPLPGVAVSHNGTEAPGEVSVTEYEGVPPAARTDTVCAAGRGAPGWYVKFTLVGVGVNVTVCPGAIAAVSTAANNKAIRITLGLSDRTGETLPNTASGTPCVQQTTALSVG